MTVHPIRVLPHCTTPVYLEQRGSRGHLFCVLCALTLPLLGITSGCTEKLSFGDESGIAPATDFVPTSGRASFDARNDRDSLDLSTTQLDTSRLRAIETRTLPQTLVEGPHQFSSLPEYYWDANAGLVARLNEAKKAFNCVPPPTFRALTLVAGTAGVGKTFIKGSVFGKELPEAALCKLDIRELYDSWREGGVVVDRPDLQDGSLVLNSLPTVVDKRQPRLRNCLEASDASFYVLDSLDEIHPDDYRWVLGQIRDFVARPDRCFVHVVVFSRPFALRDDWKAASQHGPDLNVKLFRLVPPEFYTTGDLRVSSWNYHCWKNKLSWQPEGAELESMPWDAYAKWASLGFPTSGPFSTVVSEDDANTRSTVDATLSRWACDSPQVCCVLRNLAGNSMLREIVERTVAGGSRYDERKVMEACLHAWLARESETDNRPSVTNPQHLDLYLKVLEEVAVQRLSRGDVDDWGYFRLSESERVIVEHDGRRYSFPVLRVMNHSGLAEVECRGSGDTRCRFEPAWMHRLLVEMHNDRVMGNQSDLRLITHSGN